MPTLLLPPRHYLNDGYGIRSWLLTRDHKRIALLYLAAVTFFFFIGGAFAVLIRLELATPAGDLVSDETYNKLFTMHGVMMVFFFLIPVIPSVLGNFLIPIMIGAKDLAFPKLNLASWYIYIIGGLFTLYALVSGGVDTGWTFYAPFSTESSTTNVIPTALGIFITGFSSILTGLNFIVTIHRMRAPGMTWFRMPLFLCSVYAALIFSILSFLVAIPSAVKVFNWTATMYKGAVSWETPMLYAYGFIGLFTIGGLTGLFLAAIAVDVHVTDTYFVIAHFHYIMVGGTIMGYLGGLHFWWPKMSGRRYNEGLAKLSAGIIFIGFNLTFFPQFVLGYLGMPRRYHSYPEEFQVLNVLSSAGASILGVGYLIPMIYLMWSLRYGRVAGANPWGAVGLEWTTTSPPPTENFAETPIVTWEAYDYKAPVEGHVA